MIQQFVGRQEELAFLNQHYKSGGAEFLVVYGRRRVGKTELLQQFLSGKKGLYFLGHVESQEDTINRVNRAFSQAFADPSLLSRPLRTWEDMFSYLCAHAETRRFVVVLDEFPYLVQRFPGILSDLQAVWDREGKKSKLMLILCGSSVGMMEEKVLSYKSPLYGRRTGQWKVGPLPLHEMKLLFPHYTAEEWLSVYGMLDAIPGYLTKFDPALPPMDNMKNRMLSKGEFLYEEGEFLLREEFRDVSNYVSILSGIAAGSTTFNDITTKTHLDKSLVSKYLFTLEKLGIIKKEVPVTASTKGVLRKRGLYRLSDHFFSCWLRFVYSNKESLEAGRLAEVVEALQKEFPPYMGPVFEDACAALLWSLPLPFRPARVGRWWHKGKEIDIVCLDGKGKVLCMECKWSSLSEQEARRLLHELEGKAASLEGEKHYGLFAKSVVGKARLRKEGFVVFDLKDVESLARK